MKTAAASRTLLAILCLGLPSFAAAGDGPYVNELSRCLVRSTSEADKTLLVQWIFATLALHPDVKAMANVGEPQRTAIVQKTAALFEKLLTESCLKETKEAIKYEGQGTIGTSFSVLGQAAARELFANGKVASGLSDLEKNLDSEKLRRVLGTTK